MRSTGQSTANGVSGQYYPLRFLRSRQISIKASFHETRPKSVTLSAVNPMAWENAPVYSEIGSRRQKKPATIDARVNGLALTAWQGNVKIPRAGWWDRLSIPESFTIGRMNITLPCHVVKTGGGQRKCFAISDRFAKLRLL